MDINDDQRYKKIYIEGINNIPSRLDDRTANDPEDHPGTEVGAGF